MAITFGTPVQIANAGSTQSNPMTTNAGGPGADGKLVVSAGDAILIVVRASISSMATNACSDLGGGNTYQLRDAAGHGGGGQGIGLYDAVNAAAGTYAITVTATGTVLIAVWAVNVSGLTGSPFQTAAGAEIQGGGTAGTDNYSASSVVAAAPSVVFSFLHDINAEGTTNGAPVAGTGWTSLGSTWQALGTAGANATALPIYKETSGTVSPLFSLTAANKNDFFWNETAAYAEAGNPVSIAWTV